MESHMSYIKSRLNSDDIEKFVKLMTVNRDKRIEGYRTSMVNSGIYQDLVFKPESKDEFVTMLLTGGVVVLENYEAVNMVVKVLLHKLSKDVKTYRNSQRILVFNNGSEIRFLSANVKETPEILRVIKRQLWVIINWNAMWSYPLLLKTKFDKIILYEDVIEYLLEEGVF